MNPQKGYLCLNELELGMPLRPGMMAVFRNKLPATTLRKPVLEAYRYKAAEALAEGLVDHLGGLEECLKFLEERTSDGHVDAKVHCAILNGQCWRALSCEPDRGEIDDDSATAERPCRKSIPADKPICGVMSPY